MLTPDQVVPFLQHDDEAVRNHAADYLSKAHDPSPATADDFWLAIDRFGLEHSTRMLSDIGDLPQTEHSLRRTLDSLRATGDENIDYHLQQALTWLDFPLLLAHRDELFADEKLLPHVRDHLRQRIELAERTLDDVWGDLVRHSQEVERKYWREFDDRVSLRLIEAAARAGEPAACRALERLRTGPGEDYLEIFCVQLLGELRYAAAADELVKRLIIPDADVLNEEAMYAVARVGTVDVVERLEAAYPSQEWGVRLFVHGPLGRIKRPEGERALLRMLEVEPDEGLRTSLASDLCDLCTTEGLDVVRRMVLRDEYDPQVADLDQALLAVAAMTGHSFPEAEDLRERVQRRDREREERLRKDDDLDGFVREIRQRWRRGEPPWPESRDDAGPLPGTADADWTGEGYAPSPGTYVREAPKVGRNDPCPCGSGKKYKKCCLKLERA